VDILSANEEKTLGIGEGAVGAQKHYRWMEELTVDKKVRENGKKNVTRRGRK